MQKLHIIDALGPFVEHDDSTIVNWSKVKFSSLERNGRLPATVRNRIIKRFEQYIEKVADVGYDSISIDDLAHLTSLPIYNNKLQLLLDDYRILYKRLFSIAKKRNMKVFVNTDYLFYNTDIRMYLKENNIKKRAFFLNILAGALSDFPEIAGIILRIGETDGKDVKDTFLSQLTLRSPKQANRLLKTILPLFEQQKKTLIFRTWTVGAYKVGDLIWNERTFDSVFSNIKSSALIISMKFGDTDFMRYLSLNPLFFKSTHQKIIELQTRREWEGMGTYPSFVGWDYHEYITQLATNKTIVGVHVWCQTGGWAKQAWTNVTYLEGSSFWNELNTYVTICLFRDGCSVDQAVQSFCKIQDIHNPAEFVRLLTLSEIAIKKGLYIRGLASEKLYFRRTRVPTLMWITWDKAILQPAIVYLLRILTPHPNTAIKEAVDALKAVQEMLLIANTLNLNKDVVSSLEFQQATFALFAKLRRYILQPLSSREVSLINKEVRTYKNLYAQHYSIPVLSTVAKRRQLPRRLLNIFLRETTLYRKRDRIILATSVVQRRVLYRYLRRSKSHLADQSMGVETLIR